MDTVRSSPHANMEELWPSGGAIRSSFSFDPRRTAILPIDGDKHHRWAEFYDAMIPRAVGLYEDHLGTAGGMGHPMTKTKPFNILRRQIDADPARRAA